MDHGQQLGAGVGAGRAARADQLVGGLLDAEPLGDQARHRLGEGRAGYLYVLDGELRLGDERLGGGDAAKLAGPEELQVTGVQDAELILIEVPLQFLPIGVWAS